MTPIFAPKARTGSITIGSTPPTPLGCTLGFALAGSVSDATSLVGVTSPIIKDGNYVYMAGDNGWINVIDVSDYSNPTIVGSVQDASHYTNPTWAFLKDGDYLYCPADDWFNVVDVSNPASPSFIASVQDAGSGCMLSGIVKDGDLIYGVDFCAVAIYIVDVSNPASPTFVGFYQDLTHFPDSEFGIVKDGDYLYCTSYSENKLIIYDVSNPASISLAGYVQDNTNFVEPYCSLLKDGDYLYCSARGSSTVVAFDVSNPAAPTVADSITHAALDETECGLLKDGDTLYATGLGSGGFAVIDVSNPASMSVIGSYVDPAPPADVFDTPFTNLVKFNDTLVIATAVFGSTAGIGCIAAFDVSDPTAPTITTFEDAAMSRPEPGWTLDDNHAFVRGDDSDSLAIVSLCA